MKFTISVVKHKIFDSIPFYVYSLFRLITDKDDSEIMHIGLMRDLSEEFL